MSILFDYNATGWWYGYGASSEPPWYMYEDIELGALYKENWDWLRDDVEGEEPRNPAGIAFYREEFTPASWTAYGWHQIQTPAGYGHVDGLPTTYPQWNGHLWGPLIQISTEWVPSDPDDELSEPEEEEVEDHFMWPHCLARDVYLDLAAIEDLKRIRLSVVCDDGFMIWVNGTKIVRFNCSDFTDPSSTEAYAKAPWLRRSTSFNGMEGHPVVIELAQGELGAFRLGLNQVRVAVFNSSARSSDCGFAMRMEVNPDAALHCPPGVFGTTETQSWIGAEAMEDAEAFIEYGPSEAEIDKYTTPIYHRHFQEEVFPLPPNWKHGQALFANGVLTRINTEDREAARTLLMESSGDHRCYYFRTTFEFTGDPSTIDTIYFEQRVNQACVIWINGVEVHRTRNIKASDDGGAVPIVETVEDPLEHNATPEKFPAAMKGAWITDYLSRAEPPGGATQMPWFLNRTYNRTQSIEDSVPEKSSMCHNWDEDFFLTCGDEAGGPFRMLDRQTLLPIGDLIWGRDDIFIDTEGLSYMGNGLYAALIEGVYEDRPTQLVTFELSEDKTAIVNTNAFYLSSIEQFPEDPNYHWLGAEALAYDPVDHVFYIGTQPTGTGGGGLWRVDIYNFVGGEPEQTLVWSWADHLGGVVGAGALCGDCFIPAGPFWEGKNVSRSIFTQFHGADSNDRMIVQQDLTTGNVLGSFHYSTGQTFTANEGFMFDSIAGDMFIIGEAVGQPNIFRFESEVFSQVEPPWGIKHGTNTVAVAVWRAEGSDGPCFQLALGGWIHGEVYAQQWLSPDAWWHYSDEDINWWGNDFNRYRLMRQGRSENTRFFIPIPNGEADFAPASRVYYRIKYRRRRDETLYPYEDEWQVGQTHSFMLARDRWDKTPFTFSSGSDSQGERHSETTTVFRGDYWPILFQENEEFHILAGDVVLAAALYRNPLATYRCWRGTTWGSGREGEKNGDHCLYTCLGNHDEDSSEKMAGVRRSLVPPGPVINLPGQPLDPVPTPGEWTYDLTTKPGFDHDAVNHYRQNYYYHTWGPCLFIACDSASERKRKEGRIWSRTQQAWIERVLQQHHDYKWKFIYWHHSFQDEDEFHAKGTNNAPAGFPDSAEFMMRMCREHGVTMVIHGHWHGWRMRRWFQDEEDPELITKVWVICTHLGGPLRNFGDPIQPYGLYQVERNSIIDGEWTAYPFFARLRVGQYWNGDQLVYLNPDHGQMLSHPDWLCLEVVDSAVGGLGTGRVMARYNIHYTENLPQPDTDDPPTPDLELNFLNRPCVFAVSPTEFTVNFATLEASSAFIAWGYEPRKVWYRVPYRAPIQTPDQVDAEHAEYNFTFRIQHPKLRPGRRIYWRVVGRKVENHRWTVGPEQSFVLTRKKDYGHSWQFVVKSDEHAQRGDWRIAFSVGVAARLKPESQLEYPDFWQNVGDYSGSSDPDMRINSTEDGTRDRYVWWRQIMDYVGDNTPIQGVCQGEHDGEALWTGDDSRALGEKWRKRYAPGFTNGHDASGRCYHYAWGDAAFVVLSGCEEATTLGEDDRPSPPVLGEEKKAWLVETFQTYHDWGYRWIFLFDHTQTDATDDVLGQTWNESPDLPWLKEQMDKYGVQVFFCGHGHRTQIEWSRVTERNLAVGGSTYRVVEGTADGSGYLRVRVGYRGGAFKYDHPMYTTIVQVSDLGVDVGEWVIYAGSNPREAARREIPIVRPKALVAANNGGTNPDNPLIRRFRYRVWLHRTGPEEVLKHCWITYHQVGGGVDLDLTSRCAVFPEGICVDVGEDDLVGGVEPSLNVVHFTTTNGHVMAGLWVADAPPNKICLDGYNGENPEAPLIVPLLSEAPEAEA